MQRQRSFNDDRPRTTADGSSDGDCLEQQRAEVDELLRATDQVFDSINNLQAQQYLEQNLQTGGQ
jgi:hypothetical protein